MAFLFSKERGDEHVYILSTNDSLHFRARESEECHWDTMDPAVLGDVLSLASGPDEASVVMPRVIAMGLSDSQAAVGARVVDNIVRIESGNEHDARLLSMARDFKQEFLSKNSKPSDEDIRNAWVRWKAEQEEQA